MNNVSNYNMNNVSNYIYMNNVSNYIYKNDGIYSISILVKREKTYKQCVDINYSRHYSVSCKKTDKCNFVPSQSLILFRDFSSILR